MARQEPLYLPRFDGTYYCPDDLVTPFMPTLFQYEYFPKFAIVPTDKQCTQPPKMVCKVEAQLEYTYTRCMRVFARLAPICVLSRCLVTKFLHRSSLGSLLRVRCWLDTWTASSSSSITGAPVSIASTEDVDLHHEQAAAIRDTVKYEKCRPSSPNSFLTVTKQKKSL